MGLCSHCKSTQIAWNHDGKIWVAYVAAVDATGAVARVTVDVGGGRKAKRAVPDLSKRHYPHVNRTSGPSSPDECPAWTLEAAREVKQKKSKSGKPVPAYVGLDPAAESAEADALPPALQTGGAPAGGWTRGPEAPSNRPAATQDASQATAAWIQDQKNSAPGSFVTPDGKTLIQQAAGIPQASLGTVKPAPPVAPELPSVRMLMRPEDLDAWKRAAMILECGVLPTRLMLWGPPGTGKTELLFRHAASKGWAHEYQLMTEETPGSDLIGHLAVEGGNTVWLDGSLGRAIRKSHAGPVILAIDEIGRASADALSACLLALTNPESLRLTTRAGEVMAPKVENWHVGVTSNDDPALLPPAIADRLHLCVRLDGPNPGLVETLTTAEARRLACAASREYSIRALLSYDRLRAAGWTIKNAAELVWEPQIAASFQDALKIVGNGGKSTVKGAAF